MISAIKLASAAKYLGVVARTTATAVGTAAAVDPEPVTKTALAGVALTAIVGAVACEGVSRLFRWILD